MLLCSPVADTRLSVALAVRFRLHLPNGRRATAACLCRFSAPSSTCASPWCWDSCPSSSGCSGESSIHSYPLCTAQMCTVFVTFACHDAMRVEGRVAEQCNSACSDSPHGMACRRAACRPSSCKAPCTAERTCTTTAQAWPASFSASGRDVCRWYVIRPQVRRRRSDSAEAHAVQAGIELPVIRCPSTHDVHFVLT